MKTFYFGVLMGLFGVLALFVSITFGWPAWVLFLAWICFYLFGKSFKKLSITLVQILLGIILSVSIKVSRDLLYPFIGMYGTYISTFVFICLLAFLTQIKSLNNLTAWFFGFIVFFGTNSEISPLPLLNNTVLPLITGFVLASVLDFIVEKYVYKIRSVVN